jgi:hypothetical protein
LITSLSLPAGSYVLNAAIRLANNSSPAPVDCNVFEGTSQLDPTFITVVSGADELPVTSAFTLTTTTTVSIQCIGSVAAGPITQPSTMTAIRVGTLTTTVT